MWFTNCIKGMLRRRSKRGANPQVCVPNVTQLPTISCIKAPTAVQSAPNVPITQFAPAPRLAPIPAPLLARSLSMLARQRATRQRIRAEAKRALLQLQAKLHNLPVPNREVVFDYVGLGRGAGAPTYRQPEYSSVIARREQMAMRMRRMVDVGTGTGVAVSVY